MYFHNASEPPTNTDKRTNSTKSYCGPIVPHLVSTPRLSTTVEGPRTSIGLAVWYSVCFSYLWVEDGCNVLTLPPSLSAKEDKNTSTTIPYRDIRRCNNATPIPTLGYIDSQYHLREYLAETEIDNIVLARPGCKEQYSVPFGETRRAPNFSILRERRLSVSIDVSQWSPISLEMPFPG